MEEHTEECWGLTKIKIIKLNYKWTIQNFSLCNQNTAEYLRSPTFSSSKCPKIQWYLKLYPNGIREQHKSFISYFVGISSDIPNIKAQLKYSIINSDDEEVNKIEGFFNFAPFHKGGGFNDFIKIDDVFDKTKKILHNDTLTLCCYITTGIGVENLSNEIHEELESNNSLKICEDFNKLLENKVLSDVVLVCNGKKLHAHKCVLSARSSVFSAMFNNDMKENNEGLVEIPDFDITVLTEMLRYIYTENIQITEQYSQDLLIIADKYALEGLKFKCEKFLCNKISVDNAIEILTLSNHHNCNKLKKRTIDFIIIHGKDIINSQKFKSYNDSQLYNIMTDVFKTYKRNIWNNESLAFESTKYQLEFLNYLKVVQNKIFGLLKFLRKLIVNVLI